MVKNTLARLKELTSNKWKIVTTIMNDKVEVCYSCEDGQLIASSEIEDYITYYNKCNCDIIERDIRITKEYLKFKTK